MPQAVHLVCDTSQQLRSVGYTACDHRYRQQAQEASYMAYKRAIMAEIIENRQVCGESCRSLQQLRLMLMEAFTLLAKEGHKLRDLHTSPPAHCRMYREADLRDLFRSYRRLAPLRDKDTVEKVVADLSLELDVRGALPKK